MSEHDLQRLLDADSNATDEERRILRSERGTEGEDGPSAATRAAMWANIQVGFPGGGGATPDGGGTTPDGGGTTPDGGGTTPVAASPTALQSVLGAQAYLKAALVATGVAATIGFSTVQYRAHPQSQSPTTTARLPSAQTMPLAPPTPATLPSSAPDPGVDTAPPPPRPIDTRVSPLVREPLVGEKWVQRAVPPPSRTPPTTAPDTRPSAVPPPAGNAKDEHVSRLEQEGRALSDARAALRRGDPSAAQSLLGQAQLRFPAGALSQEREALAIEALWAAGQRSEATRRAREFLARYPHSTYASRVFSFVH